MTKYKIIKDIKDIDRLIAYCKQTGYCAHDFETSGGKYYLPDSYPTILGVSFQPGSAWIIPLGHYASPFKDCYKEILQKFGIEVIQDSKIVKVAHNLIHESHWWRKYGITIRGICHDSMLAKHLLDEEKPHGLKPLVDRFLPEFSGYNLPGSDKDSFNWAIVDINELSKYCGIDCDACFRLMLFFEDRLIKNNFYNLYRNLLLMQVRVLVESEEMGMLVDRPYLDGLVKSYAEKIAKKEEELRNHKVLIKYERKSLEQRKKDLIISIKKEIEQLEIDKPGSPMIKNREMKISQIILGNTNNKKEAKLLEPINFESPKQLIDLLFYSPFGFKFKVVKYTQDKKTKKYSDTPSTGEDVIVELAKKDKTGFLNNLLDIRELNKLYSTYIVGMREKLTEDNRIHGSYLIFGTVTGRLSSRDPNFQNIPRVTTNPDIKRMFIPPPGHLCMELDYSQAELRVVAEMSGDKAMIEMFQKGYNIHCATAAKMARMPYEEFYPMTKDENHPRHEWATKMKKKAKTYNFGILYGQTAEKLAGTIAAATKEPVDVPAAEQGLKDWFDAFPGVKKWINRQKKRVKRDGFVTNPFGRKRRLPDIYADKWGLISAAEREAVNAPIQGCASDFTQFSSVVIRDRNMRGLLPHKIKPQYATVHDSIDYYPRADQIHDLVPVFIDICNNPETKDYFKFEFKSVRMKASVEIGKHWADMHEYDPKEDYTKWITQ